MGDLGKENGLGLTLIQPFSRIQCTAMALFLVSSESASSRLLD